MPILMRMPEVLANATEAIIVSWLVQEGGKVTVGQPIAEVETEKALVEVASEVDGVLTRQIALPGSSTAVGAPIAVFLTDSDSSVDIDAFIEEQGLSSQSTTQVNSFATPSNVVDSTYSLQEVNRERLFASPIARQIAKLNGIDPKAIKGTGPQGRIVRADVERVLAQSPTPQLKNSPDNQSTILTPEIDRIPLNSMRKAIARRLTESKNTIPHFYLNAHCNVTFLIEMRKQINAWSENKISINDMLVKSVAAAYLDVPDANVIWDETQLLKFNYVDISIAVSTDKGLVTPVVRNVNSKDIFEVSLEIQDLIAKSKNGKLKQNEIEGGNISISNLGMYGVTSFSAIINPPQSAILAVGAAQARPIVKDEKIVIANMIDITLAVDHRALDGALAAQWLEAFCKRVEEPMWIAL